MVNAVLLSSSCAKWHLVKWQLKVAVLRFNLGRSGANSHVSKTKRRITRWMSASLEGTDFGDIGWMVSRRMWWCGLRKVTSVFLRSPTCCVIRQALYVRDGYVALPCPLSTSSYHISRSSTCWENSAPPVTILYLCWRPWIWKTQIWIFMR